MKPLRSYSSIQAVGHRMVDDVLDGHVVVQEKIDGSQISFGLVDGELKIRSKNSMRDLDEEGMFTKGIETIKNIKHLLEEGWTYRGEYLQKPKHNTKKYDRVPKGHIALFDIDTGNQHYLPPEEVLEIAWNLGIEAVRTIYRGDECRVDMLEIIVKETISELGQKSDVGIEGVVVKNYSKFGSDNKIMMAKLVSDDFKERHKKDWKERNPGPIERIVEEINKEAVWNKSIQHLRDEGALVNEPKDIGPLMKEIKEDLFNEQKEYIKKVLYNHYKRDIFNRVKAGFPEYYKKLLRERVKEQE